MKTLLTSIALALVLFAGSTTVTAGQNPASPAGLTITVSDHGCSSSSDCSGTGTECPQSDIFYVPSSGNYIIHLALNCLDGVCDKCQACAVVRQGDSHIALVMAGCGQECQERTAAALDASLPYVLMVCLIPCAGHTCADCAGCTATAEIEL
jgi:hypothetical protein